MDGLGFHIPKRQDKRRRPSSFLFNTHRRLFPEGKAATACGCHSPPSSAEVQSDWSYTSTPPIRLHGVYRDNFIAYKSYKQEGKQTIRHALIVKLWYNYSSRQKVVIYSMHVKQLSALSTVLSTVACTDVKDRLVMKSKLTFSINVNRLA